MATASDVLAVARGELGYSRWDDPEPGTKYGRWYARDHGSYFGESGVSYCAMFVSWVFAQAGASCPGLPGAYCPWIVDAAYEAGATPYNEDAEPGDLVLFDWGADGVADHVGIVEENHPEGGYLVTIEGNTSPGGSGSQGNGGVVARRTRPYGIVRCIVRPAYDGAAVGDEIDGDAGPGREDDVRLDETLTDNEGNTLSVGHCIANGHMDGADVRAALLGSYESPTGDGTTGSLATRLCYVDERVRRLSEEVIPELADSVRELSEMVYGISRSAGATRGAGE